MLTRHAWVVLVPLLAGCPDDDDGETMGDTGGGSATMSTSGSASAATESASASASASATAASNSGGSGDSGLPPSCVGAGEDGPGPTICPDDVACEMECELDFQTCCADGMTEWTCICPMGYGGGGTASGGGGGDTTGAFPCVWVSPSCDGLGSSRW